MRYKMMVVHSVVMFAHMMYVEMMYTARQFDTATARMMVIAMVVNIVAFIFHTSRFAQSFDTIEG